MTNTRDDDGWNDLYAELGLDKPAAKPSEPAPPPASKPVDETKAQDEVAFESEPAESWPDEVPPVSGETEEFSAESDGGEDEGEEAGEGEGAAGEGEGPPGTGRKRRRRRRRRKKGAPEGAGEASAPQPVAAEAHDHDEAEQAEEAFAPVGVGEDAAGDTLRDLIANWNVPSWDDIISGLYRPER